MRSAAGGLVAVPSIKGTAFQSVHDDVHRLLAEGRLSRSALEVRLEAADLAILDEKVIPSSWYPIASYARMVELLVDLEAGGRREEYLIERGERAGARLAALGIYQQLELSLDRVGATVGKLGASLSGAIYNFTRWRYEAADLGSFTIMVEEAEAFPEVSRFTTQGFIAYTAERISGRPTQVTSERPAPQRVLFHGNRGTA